MIVQLRVPGETMSPKLHRVQVPLISRAECEKSFRTAGYSVEIDKTVICAGWPEGGKDACQVYSSMSNHICTHFRSSKLFRSQTFGLRTST